MVSKLYLQFKILYPGLVRCKVAQCKIYRKKLYEMRYEFEIRGFFKLDFTNMVVPKFLLPLFYLLLPYLKVTKTDLKNGILKSIIHVTKNAKFQLCRAYSDRFIW